MADLNYIGPVMRVELEGVKGSKMRLTSWDDRYEVPNQFSLGKFTKGSSNAGTFPYLQELTLSLKGTNQGSSGGLEFNLAMQIPYEEFLGVTETFIDCFADNSKMLCQLGYSQGADFLTEEFTGRTIMTNVSLSSDAVSVAIQGTGPLHEFHARDAAFVSNGATVFENLRYIVDSYNGALYFVDSVGNERPLDSVPANYLPNLNKPVSEVFTDSDKNIIQKLVKVYANYNMYRNGNRLVIYRFPVTEKVATFVYRGQVDPSRGFYPILDFSNANTKAAILQATQSVEFRDVNLDSKETVSDEVRHGDADLGFDYTRPHVRADKIQSLDSETLRQIDEFANSDAAADIQRANDLLNSSGVSVVSPLGDIVASLGEFRRDQAGKKLPIANRDPSSRGKAVKEKSEAIASASLQGEWSTLGNPFFKPGQKCDLRGLSVLFDGIYELLEITHNVSGGGYTTRLKGHALGDGVTESDATQKAPNYKEPKVTSPLDRDEYSAVAPSAVIDPLTGEPL